MKTLMRTGLLLLIVLLSVAPLSAEEFLTLEGIIQRGSQATTERFPNSDDILLDDFIQVTYQPDGTAEMWDDTAIKILTEKGKRANRTLALSYNTSYGKSFFTKVEIIKPNGSVVPVNIETNSKVMVNPSQMSSNIYNPNSKILTLSVPGLEVGDTLHYISCDQETKTVVPNTWSDYQVFESTTPIQHLTYQVIAPAERPLKNIALKAEVPGTVDFNQTENAEQIVYTWTVTNVPRIFEEPDMPDSYTVVQRLLVSTIEDWADLSTWYWDLCKPRLEKTTPEMKTMAQDLTAECTTTEEKIKAIFNFVSQDIRYMGITPEEEAPGYEPHDVNITFENRYGVCRDKAALLAAMLQLVDIDAFPVIIMAGPKKDEEVPQPFFNHAVTAALGDDGKYILMDSTDENTKDIFPSYLQDMSYLVARPEGETLLTSPVIPATDNLLRITTTGTLNQEGSLTAQSTLTFEGVNDTVYRGHFSGIKPEERRQFFEGHLKKNLPTAQLESFEILPFELRDTTQPLVIKMGYTADNLLIEGSANKMFQIPRLGGSLGYANFLIGETGLEQRKYPLYTGITAGVQETQNITIPENFGTIHLPDYQPVQNDAMTWSASISAPSGRLLSTNTFLLNTVEFSPEQYLALKQNLKKIEYNLRKNLIVDSDKSTLEDADVRVLYQETEVLLQNREKWTQTTRSKIQVLTYAGKKDYSEIKIRYNPAWQTVTLKHASVTQPDGTQKTIHPDEINLMDAEWVATAPRYPAERILVISLPGVGIGSVIDYELVSEVEGKPFFSTINSFNGHEPIDYKRLSIKAPKTLELTILTEGINQIHTESGDTVTYIWDATDQPPVKQEENLPAWWTFNPTVFLSTGNWETYGEMLNEQLTSAAKNQPQTEAKAKELTRGVNGRMEKAVAIRNWVAENLRTAGPSLSDLPLDAITPADQTLVDRYGNNTDCMVVLYSMLKAARFHPEFVLSGNIPLIPEAARPLLEVPMRSSFDTVLVKIELNGETIYFDGASQYAKLGTTAFNHRPMLNIANGKTGTIRVAPGKDDRTHVKMEMSISENGKIGLTEDLTVQGTSFESFHRTYAEMTPENRRRHYLEMVSGISQSAKAASELTTDYSAYPGKLTFSVHAPNFGIQKEDYLYFNLPINPLGNLLKYRSNERTLPLAWNDYTDILADYIILIPEGYEPAIVPPDFSWQAPQGAGMIDMVIEYGPLAGAIRIVQTADLQPALIPAEEFSELIEAGQKLAHPKMTTILLKRKKSE